MLKSAIFITLMVCLYGCSNSHNIEVLKIDEITVSTFKNLRESKSKIYLPGSAIHKRTVEWLSHNEEGWEPYYASVAPGNFMIRGEGFTLNVGDKWAILNYEHSTGEYRQLSKSITINEFKYLVQ